MQSQEEIDQRENERISHLQRIDVYKEDLHGKLGWMRDNDYLLRGYRTPISFADAIKRYYSGLFTK